MLPLLLTAPLNHLLAQSDWASQRLRSHAGKVLELTCGPLAARLHITSVGLFSTAPAGASSDVKITFPVDAPLRLLHDQDSLLTATSLQGPADLTESLAFVFRNLRWDAEGDVAKLTGDIVAYRLIRAVQAVFSAQQQQLLNLQANINEFIVEERRLLPQTPELVALRTESAQLGHVLTRLESRIQALGQ